MENLLKIFQNGKNRVSFEETIEISSTARATNSRIIAMDEKKFETPESRFWSRSQRGDTKIMRFLTELSY
jgi:hypothetical protein